MRFFLGGMVMVLAALLPAPGSSQTMTALNTGTGPQLMDTPTIREITSDRVLVCLRPAREQPMATGVFFGDHVRTPDEMRAAIEAYRERFGVLPGMVKTFHSLEHDFSASGEAGQLIRAIADYPGVTPLLSLEPTWYGSPDRGLLELLASGREDDRLRKFVEGIADVGNRPVLIELAAEMNARFGAPWQAEQNGGVEGPAAYIRAWRHAVDIARDAGALGIRWVFAPSAGNPYTHHPTSASHWNWYGHWYPGDEYVDYLGLHAFNHATEQGAWVPFVELVSGDAADHMLDDMARRFPDHQVIIGEFATSEHPGRRSAKARWITDAYDRMARCPAVAAAVWFDMDKEADWHLTSSGPATAAYHSAVTRIKASGPAVRTDD